MGKEEKISSKLLPPKLDVVFHALFREDNKELLEGLISDILKEKVKIKTTDKNRYVDLEQAKDKLGIMDLRAELEDGTQCNIEIQIEYCENENERILYYWADAFKRQIRRGKVYRGLKKTVSIVILDHEIKELEGIENLGVKWQIRDEETGKRILTNRLEIVIIELPKAIRQYRKDPENAIRQWMMFLDNQNKREVVQIMKENERIKKAIEELEQVSGDEKLQRIAELKEKYIRDEQATRAYAVKQGFNEGLEKRTTRADCKNGIEERTEERQRGTKNSNC